MNKKVQLITYVDRFGRKGISELHRFLNDKLQGVFEGGIHLLPFFYPIDGADAGYDPIDHTRTDHRVGTWQDVASLAEDYDIMADVIVNHISAQSPQFQDVEKYGCKSKYYDLFLTKEKVFPEGATEEAIKKIYRPRPDLPFTQKKLQTGEEVTFWTTFTSNQLDIDVHRPAGQEYLSSILRKLNEVGVRMIRLDAAGYAIKKAGTSCFMLPETYDFIDRFAAEARTLGMKVLVEIHSHFEDQVRIADKVDYVYDFALPPLVLHSIRSGRFSELKSWLQINPRNCVTVLDTHDGIGVIDVARDSDRPGLLSDGDVDLLVESIHYNSHGASRKATGVAASNLDLYQVNCTFYEALGKNDRYYLMARAIQFFCPGTPQVYYMGLLAGENDMDLLAETSVGRDINRHYYTFGEVEENLQRAIVKDLITLIRFKNTHPSFQGDFRLMDSLPHELRITWRHGDERSLLAIDLTVGTISILYTENGHECDLNFLTI